MIRHLRCASLALLLGCGGSSEPTAVVLGVDVTTGAWEITVSPLVGGGWTCAPEDNSVVGVNGQPHHGFLGFHVEADGVHLQVSVQTLICASATDTVKGGYATSPPSPQGPASIEGNRITYTDEVGGGSTMTVVATVNDDVTQMAGTLTLDTEFFRVTGNFGAVRLVSL